MNYYRRFMGDYASKTADLSLAEHGAYNVLLDTCYSTERPLPGGHDALYRLCRAMSKDEQQAVRNVADRFFPLASDGMRHNPRAEEEIAKAQSTIAKQRESGVESAAKRWSTGGSTHKSTEADAIQPPTPNHQPLTPKPQTKVKNPVAPLALPAWLNPETWAAYVKIRPSRARTPESLKGAITRLEKFRAEGFDANEIVANSLANGWQILKAPEAPRGGARTSVAEANRLAGEEAQRRFEEEQRATNRL